MNFNDFVFSYKIIVKSYIIKKKYFKGFRKLFNFPYKYLLSLIKFFLEKIKLTWIN